MIAYLNGKLYKKDPAYVIMDVNGVGYEVKISLSTYSDIKNEDNYLLHTYMHVREDAQILYGFSNLEEKDIFLTLLSVNGVGAATGLMILSTLNSAEIKHAIVNNDIATIQSVKGIGLKSAQRIILELKDKVLKSTSEDQLNILSPSHNTIRKEALSALTTLGFAKNAAEKAIDRLLKKSDKDLSVEEVIKAVLKSA